MRFGCESRNCYPSKKHRIRVRSSDSRGTLAQWARFNILESMKSGDAIQALGALASESRLAVFRLLVKRGPQGYTPSELVERLDVPAPTLSFHLKELTHSGLLTS